MWKRYDRTDGGNGSLLSYSRFHSRFAPSFTPDCQSNLILLSPSCKEDFRLLGPSFRRYNHTLSLIISFTSGWPSKLRVVGSIPTGRTTSSTCFLPSIFHYSIQFTPDISSIILFFNGRFTFKHFEHSIGNYKSTNHV